MFVNKKGLREAREKDHVLQAITTIHGLPSETVEAVNAYHIYYG